MSRLRPRFPCRCRRCHARRNLPEHPDWLPERETPRCFCGHRSWRLDSYRASGRESRRQTCHCFALPFPHRRGSNYLIQQDGSPAAWCPHGARR